MLLAPGDLIWAAGPAARYMAFTQRAKPLANIQVALICPRELEAGHGFPPQPSVLPGRRGEEGMPGTKHAKSIEHGQACFSEVHLVIVINP